ncbi:GDP-mannose 4,6-dehydratase [Candidatus Pelagibacter sp.]|nr:GDP-mannose 4,6-dehydratase [Candidatus Pelagibacter sp.]
MKKKKIALIVGVTGQDGSYLAEFLLKNKYEVHGIKRRSSSINTSRIDHLYVDPHHKTNFFLHYGDVTDPTNVVELIKKIMPHEIYNLSAQSHVKTSFEMPNYTSNVNAIGTLNILEAIKTLNITKFTKFYQASTSELFGNSSKKQQSETTAFKPQSPYATAKLFAYWITNNYRESYNMFAVNGILFNHESPRRGETFVTRKVTIGLSRIALGLDKTLYMGNIYSLRDWGHAKDYAEMQWKMLQQKKPDDYVIATGKQYSVKYFIELCCKILKINIFWKGTGLNEIGIVKNCDNKIAPFIKVGQKIIKIDKKYFRPNEVNHLWGDSSKARKKLKWKAKTNINELAQEMITSDYNLLKNSKKN